MSPELLDLIYLLPPLSDHVAKFQADRSTDLRGNLAKEIKNITGKIDLTSRTTVRAAKNPISPRSKV